MRHPAPLRTPCSTIARSSSRDRTSTGKHQAPWLTAAAVFVVAGFVLLAAAVFVVAGFVLLAAVVFVVAGFVLLAAVVFVVAGFVLLAASFCQAPLPCMHVSYSVSVCAQ
jgi:hypothetical protein